METCLERPRCAPRYLRLVQKQPTSIEAEPHSASAFGADPSRAHQGGAMKFALVNPNWSFNGSTYFGCREPHYPLELLFAQQRILISGHDSLLLDAHVNNWTIAQTKRQLDSFLPDF